MTVQMPKGGLFDAQGRLTAAGHHFFARLAEQSGGSGSGASGFSTDDEPVFIETPLATAYAIVLDRKFAGAIEKITAQAQQGTCELTLFIDGVSAGVLGSVSSVVTEMTSDAAFAEGSDWTLSLANVVGCKYLSVNIWYRRTS